MKRKINEIIKELKEHPDCAHLEYFTKEGFRDSVCSFFEENLDVNEYSEEDIDKCSSDCFKEYKNIVESFFDYAFEYCSIPENEVNIICNWCKINLNNKK